MTDARGVPLVVKTTPANVHDSQPAIGLLDAMPKIPGRRGRPREKPSVVIGDRAYGTPKNLAACFDRNIMPLLAWPGEPHGSGLGRLRWVVESCLSWFGHYRRLKVCYEKTPAHWQAFHELTAALICAKKLRWTA
jgi:transposase